MPMGCFKNQNKKHKGIRSTATGTASNLSLKTGVPEHLAESEIVTITRRTDDDITGIIFSGGLDKPNKPHITNLRLGGLASRSDSLQIDDYITAVNGIRTEKLKHEEIITLLKNAGSEIQLQVTYPLPPRAPQSAFTVKCKKTTLALVKDEDSLGLVIRGGINSVKSKSRPLTVTSVRQGGSAQRLGCVRTGDRLVAINGVNVIEATLETARRLIDIGGDMVHMVVEYDIAVMEAVQNADGPLLVEISRGSGGSGIELGISLAQRMKDDKCVLVIESIKTASIAERSGALHIGDHLLAIDGEELNNLSVAEAEHLLANGNSRILQLEILPVGHLYEQYSVPTKRRQTTTSRPTDSSSETSGTSSSVCPLDHSFYSVFSEDAPPVRTPHPIRRTTTNQQSTSGATGFRHQSSLRSVGSIASTSGRSVMCHEETMQVSLYANHIGLGLVLHSNTLPSEILQSPPCVGILESNSSAERCGILQEGDRVLAINGVEVVGYNILDCKDMLERCSSKCALTVAFDVADGVAGVAGTFQVKLFKRGGSIGITLADGRNQQAQPCIIVSDVKRGGPAYRCGAVHCDDEVLSIDNISLYRCSLSDAQQILLNTDEVVKLKLRKVRTDENTDGKLVFSVEIPKDKKSLGLSISGKEQPGHPIVISEITPGGVAERIGALCVGDVIMAINGKSLKGQTVSYAIQHLHYGSEAISLRICRDMIKTSKKERVAVNHQLKVVDPRSGHSGDSALESWGSGGSASSQQVVARPDKFSQKTSDRSDWSQVITDLENIGKLEISGLLNDVTVNGGKPSTSSPQSAQGAVPLLQNIPDIAADSELLTISMSKEEHENFGFGLSNAMFAKQQGCYICAVGKQSPADRAGLQKYDRLVQVNDVDVQLLGCNSIVPLIEEAGCLLDVLVIRKKKDYVTDQSELSSMLSSASSSLCSSVQSSLHSN